MNSTVPLSTAANRGRYFLSGVGRPTATDARIFRVVPHQSGTTQRYDPTQIPVTAEPTVIPLLIAGERFLIEKEDGVVYIRHPRWSLVGAAKTLAGAYTDLLQEVKDMAPVLAAIPVASMDADALKLLRFVSRFA